MPSPPAVPVRLMSQRAPLTSVRQTVTFCHMVLLPERGGFPPHDSHMRPMSSLWSTPPPPAVVAPFPSGPTRVRRRRRRRRVAPFPSGSRRHGPAPADGQTRVEQHGRRAPVRAERPTDGPTGPGRPRRGSGLTGRANGGRRTGGGGGRGTGCVNRRAAGLARNEARQR